MRRQVSIGLVCFTSAAFASYSNGQTTIVVPASQAEIQSTIDAASAGDTIQLSGGRHESFTLNKGLTIRGPGTFAGSPYGTLSRIDVPLGQHAVLENVTHTTASFHCASGPSGSLQIDGGRVSIIDCTLFGGGRTTVEVRGGDVLIQRCRLTGQNGASALQIANGNVVVTDSSLSGASFDLSCGYFPLSPGPAVVVGDNGVLHGSRLTVSGGSGGPNDPQLPGAGVVTTNGTSEVWLSDSTITGGSAFTIGIAGAAGVLTQSPIVLARTSIAGGNGMPNGPSSQGPVSVDPSLLGVATPPSGGVAIGTNVSIPYRCAPGTPVGAFVGGAASTLRSPLLRQPFWLSGGAAVASGLTDASGVFAVSLAVPNQAALVGQRFWFHGFGGTVFPIEVAPVFALTLR